MGSKDLYSKPVVTQDQVTALVPAARATRVPMKTERRIAARDAPFVPGREYGTIVLWPFSLYFSAFEVVRNQCI